MEKYGFVYIWRDRKHKRYYIGCRWGYENDRYICSSTWMMKAYKRRPKDFKRRILARVYVSRIALYEEEERWLNMIKPSEMRQGKDSKYYNLSLGATGHWTAYPEAKSVKERMKENHWSKDPKRKKEICKKISEGNKGNIPPNKGIPMCEEQKILLSKALKGKPITYTRSEDTRKLISKNSKKLQKEKKIGMHGKTHSEETKKLMSENNAMKNSSFRAKIGKKNKGTKRLFNILGNYKMAIPNTDKWNELLKQGYRGF
ncbi:MAG TPA: NUMOD3 domain-containing DNA-binding protein [Candidatus Glassbacteria bacterium]|nr:NUMOD3 domain-containing DNA-binding protein [Candidatus Glassbacteria bacterium]